MQSEQVLNALFKPVVKEGAKPWKMKKLSVDDFEVWFSLSLSLDFKDIC